MRSFAGPAFILTTLLLAGCDNAPPADDDLSPNDPFAEEADVAPGDGMESSEAQENGDAGVDTISVEKLDALVDAGEATLIDVRTQEEFAMSHLPGAINMPLDVFDPAAVPNQTGKETILYCRSGNRSAKAAAMLAEHDTRIVRHLDGGIVAWEQATPMIER